MPRRLGPAGCPSAARLLRPVLQLARGSDKHHWDSRRRHPALSAAEGDSSGLRKPWSVPNTPTQYPYNTPTILPNTPQYSHQYSTQELARRCGQKIDEQTLGDHEERARAIKQFMLSSTLSAEYQRSGGSENCAEINAAARRALPEEQRDTRSLSGLKVSEAFLMAAFMVASLLAYLLPSVIAYWRSARQTAAIAATNLLLGWTILGWIGALAWALANRRADE